MKRIILAMIVLCSLVGIVPAAAQQTTGNINGRIVDDQGAAVPGVTVTARSTQTGFVRTDVSDGEGLYRLTSLPVGNYEVEWRITDGSGSALCSYRVRVNDTQAPTMLCKNATVQLNGAGQASISVATVNNGSFDNCSLVSLTANPSL